jgi:isopentenyl phosphate kinase
MNELIIIKLGGSVITKKSENKLEIETKNLRRLCKEIAFAKKKLKCKFVIVHGAGPFGHFYAEKHRLHRGFLGEDSIKGFCVTHASMEKLNAVVVDERGSLQPRGL